MKCKTMLIEDKKTKHLFYRKYEVCDNAIALISLLKQICKTYDIIEIDYEG